MLNNLIVRLETKDIYIDISDDVKEFIIKKGFDTAYGARPLRRAIQNEIEDVIAEEFLEGNIKVGKTIRLVLKEDKVAICES